MSGIEVMVTIPLIKILDMMMLVTTLNGMAPRKAIKQKIILSVGTLKALENKTLPH
jgi:hypothetical protein